VAKRPSPKHVCPGTLSGTESVRRLRRPQAANQLPPLYGKGSSSDYASADIRVELQALHDIRTRAHRAVVEANIKFLRDHSVQSTKSDKITTNSGGSGGSTGKSTIDEKSTVEMKGSTTITGDPAFTAALTDINGLYDNFMNSLLQVNGSTGVIGSAAVIQGYQLATLIKGTLSSDEASQSSTWTDGTCTANGKTVTWTGSVRTVELDNAGAIQIDYDEQHKEQAYIVPDQTASNSVTTMFQLKTAPRPGRDLQIVKALS
jgi:hypothetical protein